MFSQVFFCPQGWESLSRGVSVQGGLCPGGICLAGLSRHEGVSVQGVSVCGSVQGGGICPGRGYLSRGVSVKETPYTVTLQAVCILLECILVRSLSLFDMNSKLDFSRIHLEATLLSLSVGPLQYIYSC